jgi:tRNA-binding protein
VIRRRGLRPKSLVRREAMEGGASGRRIQSGVNSMSPTPIKPVIDMAVLDSIDVRVGRIESVLAIDGSDKLMKLQVNFGDHTRTIVAGIKLERENPRDIEGKQALFVVNLPSRKMRGVVSEGMLFDIGYSDGVTPVLAVPESPVPDGARAG